jgi:hypothetical protein
VAIATAQDSHETARRTMPSSFGCPLGQPYIEAWACRYRALQVRKRL